MTFRQINRRLSRLTSRPQTVQRFNQPDVVERGGRNLVTLGGVPILSVTDADAQDALSTRQELALLWGGEMATAERLNARKEHSHRHRPPGSRRAATANRTSARCLFSKDRG